MNVGLMKWWILSCERLEWWTRISSQPPLLLPIYSRIDVKDYRIAPIKINWLAIHCSPYDIAVRMVAAATVVEVSGGVAGKV